MPITWEEAWKYKKSMSICMLEDELDVFIEDFKKMNIKLVSKKQDGIFVEATFQKTLGL